MRVRTSAWGWLVVGAVASAQATVPGSHVRVLGATMARQVETRVDPVYPAAALEKGVAGEVVLYAVVGKDGAVEQVAVVSGPNALQNAAMDAVKQWKFRPWLVNGTPAEVDTTIAVDFKPSAAGTGMAGGTGTVGSGGTSSPVAPSPNTGIVGAVKPPARPAAGAPTMTAGPTSVSAATATTKSAGASQPGASQPGASQPVLSKPGAIDWEADRRAVALPAKPAVSAAAGSPPLSPVASQPLAPQAVASQVMAPQAMASPAVAPPIVSDRTPVAARIQPAATTAVAVTGSEPYSGASQQTPSIVAAAIPQSNLPPLTSARPPVGAGQGSDIYGARRPVQTVANDPGASLGGAMGSLPSNPTGTVAGSGGGSTEWHLLKKVAPEYPPDAVEQGIEGVVLVAGVVKTDGMLRDLHVVSGPGPLRQAAVDAAAQYVYEPMMRGDQLSEARTQVPVTFTLSGPAKVAPEVMAGKIVTSFTPLYPPDAVKAGVSGEVVLHVVIGRQGQVKDVRVVSGNEMLRAAAVDAVKQWSYSPYRRNGVDVEVETDVLVRFSILNR